MYTLDRLLEDVKAKGAASGKRGSDFQDVWDALNRYVTAVVEKQQTLSISNFCKVGWRVDGEVQGKLRLRPHFQVQDSFARAYNVDSRAQPQLPDRLLTSTEELNFSKAAIRYSQSLTKDALFMGLRAILHQLGDVISSGQTVQLDFEIGRLNCNERVLKFDFAAELYLRQGLEVPSSAAQESQYRPSATFVPASKETLKDLNLQGAQATNSDIRVHPSLLGGGWEEGVGAPSLTPRLHTSRGEADSERTMSGGYSERTGASNLSAHERVHHDATQRHLTQMENQAAAAMNEKDQFEGHLQRLQDEEHKDNDWKKAMAKDHADELRSQMQDAEQRRMDGRQHWVERASAHAFPNFQESPEQSVYDYIRERRHNLKEDLDQQVEIKRRTKMQSKQHERDLETTHIEAGKKEIALMRLEAAVKKEHEKAALHDAWDRDKRVHSVRKAIEEHHKTPMMKSNMPAMLSSHGLSCGGGLGGGGFGSLPSPRDTETPKSARLLTGKVRRVPFGAAASLALHKEKLMR